MKSVLTIMLGLVAAAMLATSGLMNPGLHDASAQMPDTTGWNRPDSTGARMPDSTGAQPDSTADAELFSDEREFIQTAANDGTGEIALSRLAAERASRRDVRDFAQMLVEDHQRANRELGNLAKAKNVPVTATPNDDQKVLLDQLTKASGAGFDRAYLQGMVMDHKKAITLFEAEAASGRDADLKEWARKLLPMLRDHLARANKLSG